jgi:hypothetical protein
MHGNPSLLLLAPMLGGLLALLCLGAAYRTGRRGKLIENIPTSSTAGVFIGLVELKGVIESAQPLTSYLAQSACVYHQWSVQEHWSRTVTETYRDSKGRTRTRTRRESGWKTVSSGGESIPFFLKDDDGRVLVRPEQARIEPASVFDHTCGRSDPLYYEKGPEGAVAHSDHRRRFHETALPVGQAIYVIGQAREREDVVAPEIAHDPQAPMFLISIRPEQQIQSRHRTAFRLWNVAGFALSVGGAAVAVRAGGMASTPLPGWLMLATGLYGLVAALAWLWLAYNSLVDLRQRVRRAWSHVDVQLKRRHDLIPNLIQAVRGLRDHERNLQEELAALRSQLEATAPGDSGPDYHGLNTSIRLLAERYPDLRALQGFETLQKNLADTEQRIALARGYFNELATHYNTRLETIPEKFVGRLARMKRRALLVAEDFERAPVGVELAVEKPDAAMPRS